MWIIQTSVPIGMAENFAELVRGGRSGLPSRPSRQSWIWLLMEITTIFAPIALVRLVNAIMVSVFARTGDDDETGRLLRILGVTISPTTYTS